MQSRLKVAGDFFQEKKMLFALIIALVFFCVQLILVRYHELWSDEIHAWEIVRCSHSYSELLFNTRYEGHQQLWFVILYLLQKVTLNLFVMQVVHVFIAACTVFVFCFYSPFKWWQNILFCAGYFFSYEYSIISRNYAIETVLLFLSAGVYTKYQGKYFGLLSVLFFLLFQTNVFALLIGLPLYIYILYNIWQKDKTGIKRFIIPTGIVLLGIVVAIITTMPPADSAFSVWTTKPDIHRFILVLSTGFTTYFPFPELRLRFWDSNFLNTLPHHIIVEAILGIVTISIAGILFSNNKKILLLFIAGTAGPWLFYYVKYYGYIRHHGHIFLIFIVCYWLYSAEGVGIRNKLQILVNRYFVTAILLVQIAASCCANVYDVKYVFSNDVPAAEYIHASKLDTLPLLGDADFPVAGIAGALHQDIYFMRPVKWGKYILPDKNWGPFINFREEDLLLEVNKKLEEKQSDVVVILSTPYKNSNLAKWKLLHILKNSVLGEDYYIYLVKYVPPSPEALNSKAEELIGKNQLKGAMALLGKAINIDPHYGIAYMNLADCYNNGLKDYDKALANIDSAIKYSPQDYRVVFDRGAILYNGGHRKEGVESFKEAVKLAPQNVNTYLTIGKCDSALKEYDKAIEYLKMALKIKPGDKAVENAINNCNKAKGSK